MSKNSAKQRVEQLDYWLSTRKKNVKLVKKRIQRKVKSVKLWNS